MPLCFDLDGTLGSFGGGYVLLREALGELWHRSPEETELRACRGSTDWEIVAELHQQRFGTPLSGPMYQAFEHLCLRRFAATFHPEARQPVAFQGILDGLHRLAGMGQPIWLVSGNVPLALTFKARALGVDPTIHLQGSLPGLDRAGLLRRALAEGAGPHLYVGDRPHDRQAAEQVGVPFLGIGAAVPGDHPQLSTEAEAEHLVAAVLGIISRPRTNPERP